MSHVLTMPDHSDVTMTVTGPLTHLCPIVDEVDEGAITIVWRICGETYELHSLAEYLRGFKDAQMAHEEITDQIRHELSIVNGIELLSVETTWETAGMEVRCSTSPTRADQL